jgi:hypothetical protein
MNELLSPYCAPSCTLQRPDCRQHGMEGEVPYPIAAQHVIISWPREQRSSRRTYVKVSQTVVRDTVEVLRYLTVSNLASHREARTQIEGV